MDKLVSLLNTTKLVTSRANAILLEKEKRGENFNVFEILKLSRFEAKLHTPFIAELLNPNGSHGLNTLFLKAFVEYAGLDVHFDYQSTVVKTEFHIGYRSEDCTKGGIIDILIIDKFKNAIIIENKIYAEDQKNQLLRYSNYAKDNGLKSNLLYLTLEGKQAEAKSLGNKNVEYKCISYRTTILKWLGRCVELSSCYPLVRETIRQYITNLKMLMNIMDTDSLNEIVKITTSAEYVESALDIISNQWNITTEIRKKFVLDLENIAKQHGLLFDYDEGIWSLCNECYITFYNPKLSENWAIYIGADKHNGSGGVFYGIRQREYNKPQVTKNQLCEVHKFWEEGVSTSEYPFGWAYLRGSNGNWWDWSNPDTLKDMVNGKLAIYIENEIIIPVLENKLLQRIDRLTAK